MVLKRVLCPQRLRRVPRQFSWVDHRLVRDRHITRCSHPALALYLFLVTVCDGEGLSYWSDAKLGLLLRMDGPALAHARQELITARLIAYQPPLYQVLALDPAPAQPAAPAVSVAPPASPAPSLAPSSQRRASPPPQPIAAPPVLPPAQEPPRERMEHPIPFGQVLREIMEHAP